MLFRSTDDEFAKKWGDLGPIYGKQWRSWKIGERRLRWSQLNEEQKSSVSKETLENTHPDVAFFTEEIVIDQIANSINKIKTDPDSRRNKVSAWNVGELDQMTLPPCHTDFQFYTRELSLEERHKISMDRIGHNGITNRDDLSWHETYDKTNIPTRAISLMFNMRSVDTFLGLPFNIASYGLLLEIIAKEVNMVPDELIGNLGDTHLYSNHIEQAKEQIGRELSYDERFRIAYKDLELRKKLESESKMLNYPDGHNKVMNEANIPTRTREPYPLPKLVINDEFWNPDADLLSNIPHIQISDFYVTDYQSHPTIKAPLSN